ncbi:tripartite tricarboxylate transporter TctB family protein [Tropicimonas isoalkanivorans]|uniref:tripartite tricarboxylate transporter TctB family protein n=1 Tax=Tropicimonas isoalkanivorans TaxID=441112 RepID=UPI0015A702BA|nr:tripartite tricarboxylate transporter TctB family protein [Tropicimonas isoalkanivorans]
MQNLLLAGLSASIALIGLYGAWGMDLGSLRRIGQGAFPVAMSVLLLILAAAVVFSRSDRPVHAPPKRTLLLVSGSMIAFALLLPIAGLIGAVIAATVICAAASSESRVIETIALSVFLAASFAALFVYGLGLTIPLGPE